VSAPGPFPGLDRQTGEGVARSAGAGIAWRAYGRGEPVIMVMGFMGSGRAWFRLLPYLSASRRAVVLDNRGTGDSDRPLGLWSMDGLAADVLAVMNDAGLERAHVVGASMGGMIAQHFALAHPDRIRSLALACTHPGGLQPGAPPWRMFASLFLRPVLGQQRTFPIVAPMLYSSATRRLRPERMREDGRFRLEDGTPIITAPSQAAAIYRHDTRRRLSELRMPVLIVHGEQDRLISPENAHRMAREIPGARLLMIRGAGHMLTTDAEEETADALLGFFDDVEDGEEAQAARSAGTSSA
jgi:3-oxoadipate enol-lactonase